MFDWACWIAYAPLMAIFFAVISYGRTIRQFMIVNWIFTILLRPRMVLRMERYCAQLAADRKKRI